MWEHTRSRVTVLKIVLPSPLLQLVKKSYCFAVKKPIRTTSRLATTVIQKTLPHDIHTPGVSLFLLIVEQ